MLKLLKSVELSSAQSIRDLDCQQNQTLFLVEKIIITDKNHIEIIYKYGDEFEELAMLLFKRYHFDMAEDDCPLCIGSAAP